MIVRVIVFTDGFAKEYKGGRKTSDLLRSALTRLALSSSTTSPLLQRFKGTHDGTGGVAKTTMRIAEVYGNFRIPDSLQTS